MRFIGSFIILLNIIFGVYIGVESYQEYYHYNNDIYSYWSLADKTSTLADKSKYLDTFVQKLDSAGLQGQYSTVWAHTPDSSFDQNFIALQSLQSRLHQIQTVDPNSLAYQQAINQITAQEQGEAQDMLNVFEACYEKVNYPVVYWNGAFIALIVLGLTIGVFFVMTDND